ncbi:MAG: hypothetical protein KDI03_16785 [Anaerolineae bacterium]|nr:hypothetical protein [Anaerolineae bacterium]MCB0201723.1 hypothetical protein [Anaerolineae bacterium]MCB0206440.1 hypothetical protein [Anaerolineae bacterium]MCB0257227.1 hypothetical protein [Anaerolineae bacterium]
MDTKVYDPKSVVNPDEIEALYVQTSHAMSYEDGKLTLHTLAPTTLFFSDRPDRVTGHISSEEFVDSWDQGEDSFASNPPNAALSIFHPDMVSDVIVELTDPKLDGHTMTYQVVILDGEMPAEGGPSALFIDVIGRPLSPVSVAGAHRRDRREDRRDRR